MAISVSSKTSNSITVSCSYPTYVPPQTDTKTIFQNCTITWYWKASSSSLSKTATSQTSSVTIRWYWTWSGTSWSANGWDHYASSTKTYSDVDGYSGTLDITGVSPGTRPSPPATGNYPVGTGGHVDTSSGTAGYSGTVYKTTYSWVENGWDHSAASSFPYDDGTYSGSLPRTSVSPGSRPSISGSPSSASSTTSSTSTGVATYSGTVTAPSSGANITRSKMYLNGVNAGDGSASNSFSYTFNGLSPKTTYNLSVQWFSSGDTLVGSNSVSEITNDVAAPPTGSPSSLSLTAQKPKQISCSWSRGTVVNQDGYHVYVNNVWKTSTSSTSATVNIDNENVIYTVKIVPYNVAGSGAGYVSDTVRSLDETAPTLMYITVTQTSSSVTMEANGFDNTGGIGLSGYSFYLDDVQKGTVYGTDLKSYTINGLLAGQTYVVSAKAFDADGNYSTALSKTVTIVMSGLTGLQQTGKTVNTITVEWNAVNGASKYNVYKNNVYLQTVTGATTYTLTGLTEFTTYNVGVIPVDSANKEGSGQSILAKTKDVTPPVLTWDATTTINSIAVEAYATDTEGSGVAGYEFWLNGVHKTTITGGGVAEYTYTGLVENSSYTVTVKAFDVDLNYASITNVIIAKAGKPKPFDWLYSFVASGASAIVDRRDWNRLTLAINDFRAYKSLSSYSFTTITTSHKDISAALFNQLVSGANGLSAYMTINTMPSTKSTGDTFYASYLNNIVTSINSIN